MSAQPRMELSNKERQEVRKRVLEFYRSQPLIVLEAMGELFDWHAAYAIDDPHEFKKQVDKVLSLYLEKAGIFAKEEQEELDAIARGIF